MNDLSVLILQIFVVILFSRLLGVFIQKLHQPQVVGEMLAGVLLGPTLLSSLSINIASLFSSDNLTGIYAISQLGLILFLFLIGLEVDINLLKGHGKTTFFISLMSMLIPFFLGWVLARYLYLNFSSPDVSLFVFSLFIGTAMSVTAFPVLARILMEQNLIYTKIGSLCLSCAAIGDVVAWILLAIVVTFAKAGDLSNLLYPILGIFIYLIIMFFLLRPLLNKLILRYVQNNHIPQNLLALLFLLLLVSSYATEKLGLHSLFGAFIFGVMMPRANTIVKSLVEKIEPLTVIVMLPLFFAYIGLRTNINVFSQKNIWFVSLIVILVAILGKVGSVFFTARLAKIPWRDATILGVLMNTRGLMELVILSIGLDLKVVSLSVFAMMVIMTIVTTMISTPIVKLLLTKDADIYDPMPSSYFPPLDDN
jgi:Kef-type K+ transport system membrane component KefB